MPTFTVNWHNEPSKWQRFLSRFAGQPARGLEIGCFEGRSACWLLDHILTHPNARLDCVDPFAYAGSDSESRREAAAYQDAASLAQTKRRLLDNLAPYGERVRHWQLSSDEFFGLARLRACRYAIVAVDGMHSALPALRDLLHGWELLQVGGLMIVDDLHWKGRDGFRSDGPQRALDALLGCLPEDDVAVRYRNYIAILERLQ